MLLIYPYKLNDLFKTFVERVFFDITHYQFPSHFEPVLEHLLSLSVQKLISFPWTGLLDTITPLLPTLDESTAQRILQKTVQYIPTPPPFFTPILFLAQKLFFHPSILGAIATEQPGSWDLVLLCLTKATRANSVYYPLSPDDFKSVLTLMRELVCGCPALVNRIWDMFTLVIIPYLTGSDNIGIQANVNSFQKFIDNTHTNLSS